MDRFSTRSLFRLGVLIIIGLALGFGGRSANGQSVKTVTIAQPNDAVTMDPMMSHHGITFAMLVNMFEGLVEFDRSGKWRPVLAESWEHVNPTIWRFRLRQGVKFHNGEPFDARAVKYSIERAIRPDMIAPPAYYLGLADAKVAVVNPTTVLISTNKPFSALLAALESTYIVPPGYVEQIGKDAFARAPVGTGPYKFVEWVKDQRVVLEANPDYWAGAPKIKRIVFRPILDASARVAALRAGEVDLATGIDSEFVPLIERDSNLKILTRPGGPLLYIGLNTLKGPFADRRVRQAANYAVDVDSIIKNLLGGRATPSAGLFTSATPGYDSRLRRYPYDPQKAKQLLTEAGVPNGFEAEWSVTFALPGSQKVRDVFQAIQQQLAQVGIRTQLRVMDNVSLAGLFPRGEIPMYGFSWSNEMATGRHFLLLVHSKTRGWFYRSPQADGLIDEFLGAIDPDEQVKVGRKLQRFLYDEAIYIYLYQEPHVYGARANLVYDPKPSFETLLRVQQMDKQ
ncbi:MAG: ABC transporter substrate-binding protein [bacterium]